MIINCPECEKKISSYAYICPCCGFPLMIAQHQNDKIKVDKEIEKIEVNSDINNNFSNEYLNAFSCVYTVEEIQEKLGIGRRQAYELVNSGQFPAKKLARKFLIPKRTFEEWLLGKNN